MKRQFRALLLSCACLLGLSAGLAQADAQAEALVFIDDSVRNPTQLLSGLPHAVIIYHINSREDPLQQIAKALAGHRNVGSLHILSHGSGGVLQFGAGNVTARDIASLPADISARFKAALSDDADVLLYGCNIGAGKNGAALVSALADATGADVAASTDLTGGESRGGNWSLEYQDGEIATPVIVAAAAQQAWNDVLAIGVTVAGNTTTLLNALGPTGMNGVSYSGTPTILGTFASNAYGTFTTSGSALGMTSGAVFGTGNVSQISGTPSFFWDGAGTGNTSGAEFDRAALTFTFTPDPGVTKVVFRYILGSEEYNEYVGQNFSDNITIRLTGGAYSGTNVALVPGTSTGIDIDTINANLNSSYYRDNTVASPPVPDSVLDGHTTALKSITSVVPSTSYSAEIKVADFTDNLWNSALFVDYFGASLLLDLDNNNSSGATLANYQTTFTEGGSAVAIADTDALVTNYDSTTVQSATITLTNAQASDVLAIGTLPGGITGSVNTSVPGIITVTLTGSASNAAYQSALAAITFSNSSVVPNTTTRNVTVAVNDGVTNSNTAATSITFIAVPTYLYTVNKTASAASIASPGGLTYTVTVANTGDGNITGVTPLDTLTQGASNTPISLTGPAGDSGTIGTLDIGETWTYAATVPVTQARIDATGDLVNTVSVTTTQTPSPPQTSSATTTITRTPQLSIVKTADQAGPVNAGNTITYSFVVTNSGNVTMTNVGISDVHNGFGTYQTPGNEAVLTDAAPANDSTDGGNNGIWDSLGPGDSVRFTASYQVVQLDIDNLQ